MPAFDPNALIATPEFRRMGLSENVFHVLCLLVANNDEQASPSELSELVGTSRANMTRILATLVDEGLATRQTEEQDGRRHMIQITDRGRHAALDGVRRLIAPLHRGFAGLDPDEQAQLGTLLRKCIKSFDDNASRFGSPARGETIAPVAVRRANRRKRRVP